MLAPRLPFYQRYIIGAYALGMAPIALLLLGLFSFLLLGEELEDIGQGTYLIRDALAVVALGMPRTLLQLLPVITLLGGLIGLGALASGNELVAMRAAGFTPSVIARPVIYWVLLLVAGALVLQTWVVPAAERNIAVLRGKAIANTDIASDGGFWTRDRRQYLRVSEMQDSQLPAGLEIYELDLRGRLSKVIQAEQARILDNQNWLLQQVSITTIEANESFNSQQDSLAWRSFLTPRQIASLVMPVETMSPATLYRHITRLEANAQNAHRYRVMFWQQLALPIGLLAMGLLALPFVMGSTRHLSAGVRIAAGVSIGIAFYLLEQTTGHFALLLELPAALTALAPQLLLLTVALWGLRRIH